MAEREHPMVTLAVRPHEVRLHDQVETRGGQFVVAERTERAERPWILAGDPPGHVRPWRIGGREETPLLSREVSASETIRVRRRADQHGRLTGHARQVSSYEPRSSGSYTLVDEWTAACRCGWQAERRLPTRWLAEQAWLRHKAETITAAAYETHPGLAAIAALEAAAGGELPVLPWSFARQGAEVRLDGWPLTEARAAVTAWGAALDAVDGLTDLDTGDEVEHGVPGHGPRGVHVLDASGRAAGTWVRIAATVPARPVETVTPAGGVL